MTARWFALLAFAACRPAPVAPGRFSVAAPPTAISAPAPAPLAPAPAGPLSAAQRACLDALGNGREAADCRIGDVPSCYRAAALTREPSCRETLYQHSCDAGIGAACSDLAVELLGPVADLLAGPEHGTSEIAGALGRSARAPAALALARRGCGLSDGRACLILGGLEEAGAALAELRLPNAAVPGEPAAEAPQRAAAAAVAFERGCGAGNAVCCRKAAQRASDHDKQLALYRRACERNDALGCVRLAELVGASGSPQDVAVAKEILRRACRQDEDDTDEGESCARLVDSSDPTSGERGKLLARACQKGNAGACFSSGQEAFDAGRYAEAVAPLSRYLARERGNPVAERQAALQRAEAYYFLGRFAEAAAAFEPACADPGWSYCELLLFTARSRSGDRAAKTLLRAATKRFDLKMWPGPVAAFFLGDLGEAELLRQSSRSEQSAFRRERGSWQGEHWQLAQKCEAQYYLGAKLMIDGDSRRAARHFEQAVATGVTNFIEYISAKAELARLKR